MSGLFSAPGGQADEKPVALWPRAALAGLKTFLYLLPLLAGLALLAGLRDGKIDASALTGAALIIFLFPIGFISGPLAARRASTWAEAGWLGVASGFIPAAVNFAIAFFSIFSSGEGLKFVGIGFFCGAGWLVCGGLGGLAGRILSRLFGGGGLEWKPVFALGAVLASLALLYYVAVIESGSVSETMEAKRQACAAKAQAALTYRSVTESHEPGSGYIKVKAVFVSKIPLSLGGASRTLWNYQGGPLFFFITDLPMTKLEPGVPRELELHLVANPGYPGIPPLAADGPYYFPEVYGSVHGFQGTEEMSDWCPLPLIKGLRTGPYKAADFARLIHRESKTGFSYLDPVRPGGE